MARLVIVDDSPVTRQLLKAIVEAAGHTVLGQADNGRDGLRLARELAPDLLLLDMLLPQLDGIEVLTRLRGEQLPLKVIMLSSVTAVEKVRAARAAGANSYVLKPFEADKVIAEIAKVLGEGTGS